MLMFQCHLLSDRNILRKGVCIDGDPRGPRGFQPLVWLLQKNSFHSFQDFRLIDPSKKSGPLVQIFTCIYLTICWQVNIPIWKYMPSMLQKYNADSALQRFILLHNRFPVYDGDCSCKSTGILIEIYGRWIKIRMWLRWQVIGVTRPVIRDILPECFQLRGFSCLFLFCCQWLLAAPLSLRTDTMV